MRRLHVGQLQAEQSQVEKSNKKHMFSNAQIRALLIPLMVEQLLNCLMGMADTLMISNVGPVAMSAVSLVDSINILFIQAFSALAAGGCIVCSQYIGKKDEEKANQSAKQMLLAVFAISALISLVCLAGGRAILKLIFGRVEEAVMEASAVYFFYTALSYPFIGLYNGGAAIYRAQGNSKRPMAISVISNVMNIGGNAFFIWVLHLGVAGVAVATLLSRVFCAVTVLAYLHRPGQVISVRDYLKVRPDKKLIVKVLSFGIPTGIENGMFQFGKLAIQSAVSAMGTAVIAAQAMVNILEILNGIMAMGIGMGAITIIGQCIGAGEKEEAAYYIKKITLWGEICMIGNCLLVYALTRPVTIIGGMEAESAALCISMVGWITVFKPLFWVLAFLPAYGMRAAGDVNFLMGMSIAVMWICRVSLCLVLVHVFHLGLIAVWIGIFADWGARAVICPLRFKSGKWLEHGAV
ncbi:MAG: MATE family efflux transporter [Clostridium sp.]|nr:MATE family efflux transporter [Clostridium sp.]